MALLTGIALAVAEDEVDEVDELEVEDGDEVNESAVPASAELLLCFPIAEKPGLCP